MISSTSESKVEYAQGEQYWASIEDPGHLASECYSRIDSFQQFMRSSAYWNWSMRSWRYYNNLYFDSFGDQGQAIQQLGPDDDQIGMGLNHVRNIGSHLHNLATRRKLAWKTRAVNAELESLKQATLGDQWLEYRIKRGSIGKRMKRAAEQALVLLEGFMFGQWDWNSGDVLTTDEDGLPIRNGEVVWKNPLIFDVVRDPQLRTWDELEWVLVRTWENKWSLSARERDPDRKRAISELDGWEDGLSEDDWGRVRYMDGVGGEGDFDDLVPVWHFIHKDTDAVPGGRYFRFATPEVPLMEAPIANPYGDEIPLYRMTAGEILMTSFGYSPLIDVQAPNEMLNAEMSMIAQNHSTFGVQHVWAPEDSEYDESRLSSGTVLIKGGQKPAQGINLAATPAEYFKMVEALHGEIETLGGVNAVMRGQAGENLSGEALKVWDARAVEFAAPFLEAYNEMGEDCGTFELRSLRDFMDEFDERYVVVSNESSPTYRRAFTKKDLANIDRVTVESGNPMLQTLAGRVSVAEFLVEKGLVVEAEEFLTLIETGQLKPLTNEARAKLDLIHSENEALREGKPAMASAIDHHVLHIKEHSAELNSPEARMDPQLTEHILAHVMEHIELLTYMPVIMLQMSMGYETPFPAMQEGMPPSMGGEPGALPPPQDGSGGLVLPGGGPMEMNDPRGAEVSETAADSPSSFSEGNLDGAMSLGGPVA